MKNHIEHMFKMVSDWLWDRFTYFVMNQGR